MENEAVLIDSSRLKSVVWKDFDRVKFGDSCVAMCKHCQKKLSGSSTSGTSHLRNHLVRCRRRLNHDIPQLVGTRGRKKKEATVAVATVCVDQQQQVSQVATLVQPKIEYAFTKDCSSNLVNGYFDQKRSRFDLARMIIMHGYPLQIVEDVGFKTFVRNLQPLFEFVTFDGVEGDCMQIYHKEKQKVSDLLDKLPGKISLSADMWTGKGEAKYLCLTAHCIDDEWKIRKKILNFLLVDPSHTEDMLSDVIMMSLMEWDIDQKLFSMTFNTCSTYDNIICKIRDRLSQSKFLLCDGQLFHVSCAGDLIKHMAQDALEAVSDVTDKIRESIRYVKSSQAMQEKFNEMAQLVGINSQKCLFLDNALQWSSTFFMIDIALEFKDAFSLLPEHDPVYTMCPSFEEWDRALHDDHYSNSTLASDGQNSGSVDASGNDTRDRLTGFDRFVHETSQGPNKKTDLDKYLEEPLFPHSAFDAGDQVLDPHWSVLRSNTVQALMCARDWMQNDSEDSKSSANTSPLAICYDTS
ncbi:zinc finger BED domain-containing protein RICESLEEPER 1-like [Heracleum sosnowskyi]|uniref:Zinc finger BED domain-containing protein RICESLEEPER 1-like n=1 Tax=Heracleum sosnowskyi TaxID=360622 RepID=A0AAD8N2B5_9APIA|nr:zinc finger BED domain-containing protein RICESLEEPER 1-like [Heracleum sosnowskyi]